MLSSHPLLDDAKDEGILSIPYLDDWEQRPVQTHIVPLCTRPGHEILLFFHLLSNNFNAYPFTFPVVPKGRSRVRLVVHAHNSTEQIEKLVSVIFDWVSEMLEIERQDSGKQISTAASQLYAMQDALTVREMEHE